MKKTLIATSVALMATSSYAADYIVPQEPAPVVIADTFSWTGGYIGAHGGYGWAEIKDKNNNEASKVKPKGGFGGLQAGYNWQFDNNIVVGLEGDISFGSMSKSWDGRDKNQYNAYYGKDKIGTHGTVRARLGYAVDNFMPYVTGGLAIGETKHSLGCDVSRVSDTNGCGGKAGGGKFDTSESKTKVGYALGAGAEYALTNNWTIKAEYMYSDLGNRKVTLTDPYKNEKSNRKFKASINEVRFGVNYKF